MKKLLWLVPFILLLCACNDESEENYTQMLGAFERNDSELNTLLDDAIKNIDGSADRDQALKNINDKIIPKVEDFRQTLNNYTLTSDSHVEVRDSMLNYLNDFETLMKMYSKFNTEFYLVNPLSDESINEEINNLLDEIKAQEEKMSAAKEKVEKLIGENAEE